MTQALERIEAKDYRAIATALSEELAKSAVERDLRAGVPDEEIQRLRETDLLSVVIPQEYGGGGLTWVQAFKLIQTLSKSRWFDWTTLRQSSEPDYPCPG